MNYIRTIPARGRSMHNSNLFKYALNESHKDQTVKIVASNGVNYIVKYRYLRSFVAEISTITKVIVIYDENTGIVIS